MPLSGTFPNFGYTSDSLLKGRLGSFLGASKSGTGTSGDFNWGALSLGLAAGSALSEAVGAYSADRLKAGSYDLESASSAMNAQMAELSAEQTLRAGQAQVAQITRQAGALKARQRAGFAASGVAVGVGSSAEVMASTDVMKEVDKQTAEMNALQSAWGYRTQAITLDARSKAASTLANAYRSSAGFSAFGSLLSGATQVAGMYYGRS